MKKAQLKTVILHLERQIEKNNGYFECICEGLDIDHKSSLIDILKAIDEIKGV